MRCGHLHTIAGRCHESVSKRFAVGSRGVAQRIGHVRMHVDHGTFAVLAVLLSELNGDPIQG